ncbi:MAG: GNAT family N-acetyltransferase [Clostridia bacterium]
MKKEFLILHKPDDLTDCFDIRNEVFILEQKFEAEIEIDENDDIAYHVKLMIDDQPAATARYFNDGEHWHLGRFAILKQYRSLGLGRQMLEVIENDLKEKGINYLCLSSQHQVIEFYEKCGYEKVGDMYLEEDYPHIKMEKYL